MHDITDLPAWERLFKKIVWKQLGDIRGITEFRLNRHVLLSEGKLGILEPEK